MARVNPTAPTNPPSPPIQRGDRATFSARVDATITYLTGAPAEIYGLAQNTYNNAVDAFGSADAAATSASAAAGSATSASGFADNASDFADAASTSATAAANSATAAANSAAALTATSTSSLVIGTGTKAFTVQANRQFSVGQALRAVNPTNTAQWMVGAVTSYSGTALVLDVTDVNPATAGQTVANWSISISGVKGATGAAGGITGGNLTGALNYAQAGAVPVSATPDIWSGAGNLVPLTGTGTITGFPAAPQVGATRTLVVSGDTTLTSDANLQVYGGTVFLGAGDLVDVVADSGSVFRATVRRRDGSPVNQDRGTLHNLRVFESSGVFTATKTGWHKITCVGGSGSAGIAAAVADKQAAATGAGAGGFCQGVRFLTAGVSYIVAVGSGGAAPAQVSAVGSNSNSSTAANGNDGSLSSFSGTGVVALTANGGGGGKASVVSSASPLAGGVGGSASGGLINVKGGDGGTASQVNGLTVVGTGGGAVGLRGTSFNGGDATVTGQGAYAAGGAGVGGNGATATAGVPITGGGGSAGPASGTNGGANYRGIAGGSVAGYAFSANDLDNAIGAGLSVSATFAASAGGGSAGSQQTTLYAPGSFAGGGGVAITGGTVIAISSTFGGAPGGTASRLSSVGSGSLTVQGAAGSAGGVWIEF